MLKMCVSNSILQVYVSLSLNGHVTLCDVIYIMPTTIQTQTILQALHQRSLLTCLLWRCKVHLCLNKDRNRFCAEWKKEAVKSFTYKKKKTMRETAWNVLYFQNVICIICFVSKINIVVSKKLPKMADVPNVIQKISHKQNDMAIFFNWFC